MMGMESIQRATEGTSAPVARELAERVALEWGCKIPLRDGVHLNATVYRPIGQTAPKPCVFTLTPYIADNFHQRGMYFAAHGVPFVIVDARGRGNSEGVFRPRIQEARDGYDLAEWLAAQPYCNGKVAMWGGSYAGYDQWATAKEFPPHLATIVPVAAPWYGVDVPMRNNIFSPYALQWLTFVGGRTPQAQLFADGAFWAQAFRRWHESGRPFRELDQVVGARSAVLQEYLSHPEPDAYWEAFNPSPDEYARITLPVLSITGCYDDNQPGALEHYRRHMRYASPEARARHYLIIGPWDHAGTRTPAREFAGLTAGPESLLDLPSLHLEWYAWTMEAGPKPEFLQKQVAYYVMGAEQWRYADSLDGVTARHERLFLSSARSANDVFDSGSLVPDRATGGPDHYTYDPCDTSGPEVEAEARSPPLTATDQSVILAMRGRQLVYHTAPFEEDTEVSGFFRLSAWISIDCPDTDIYVSVYAMARDGSSIRLATDAIRARYREGLRNPKPIRTQEPLRYDFDRFTFISRRIARGNQLRLVIAPVGRLIDSNFWQKNYNGGGVVAEESSKDGRAVTVTLFHDDAHPSALHVPIGQAAANQGRART